VPLDYGELKLGSEVVVQHFYSPVVEGIMLTASLFKSNPDRLTQEDADAILQGLSNEALAFIDEWATTTGSEFYHPLEFLLRCPCFYDSELFLTQINQLSHEQYVYQFWAGAIELEIIRDLLEQPTKLSTMPVHILWENPEKLAYIIKFLSDISRYRTIISNLLQTVFNSTQLEQRISASAALIDPAIAKLQTVSMEPLALAQYIMGKTFRRISPYKAYYFIPSYYITPAKVRIFDTEMCIVIYGCAAPLSDTREESAQLELELKALSDRNRLMILRMLSGKREYGAKLAEYLGITTATVSHHLDLLKKAGFVKEEKIGTIKYFTCDQEHTHQVLDRIQHFLIRKS